MQKYVRKALGVHLAAQLHGPRERNRDSKTKLLRSCLDNEMRKTTLDYWVGVFVVLGAIALLFLALKVGNMNAFSFSRTYPLELTFNNIGSLKPRAPVKSAGVSVGRIARIQLDNTSYQARVRLDIDQRYQFPRDSSAKILTAGLLGEQYIGITPGSDEQMLPPGGTMTMTQSAIVLENLVSQFLYSKAAGAGGAKSATDTSASDKNRP